MQKVLITGITGMVGSHLLDYLLKNTKWKPKVKFKDGIKITIEWMKKNFKSVNKNIYHI